MDGTPQPNSSDDAGTPEPGARLEWCACQNVRDLGGYPTAGGGVTRRRVIVRADDIGRLTPSGWAALEEYGVGTIIDLRHDSERENTNAVAAQRRAEQSGIEVLNIPLFEEIDRDTALAIYTSDSLIEAYRVMVSRCRLAFASVMQRIASCSTFPVLVHCQSGRDRTGLVSALLLAVAGARLDVIATDYARSIENLTPASGARGPRGTPLDCPDAAARTIIDLFGWIERRWGGPVDYLRSCCVSDEELQKLSSRLRDVDTPL